MLLLLLPVAAVVHRGCYSSKRGICGCCIIVYDLRAAASSGIVCQACAFWILLLLLTWGGGGEGGKESIAADVAIENPSFAVSNDHDGSIVEHRAGPT